MMVVAALAPINLSLLLVVKVWPVQVPAARHKVDPGGLAVTAFWMLAFAAIVTVHVGGGTATMVTTKLMARAEADMSATAAAATTPI